MKVQLAAAREIQRMLDSILLKVNVADSGEARIGASICLTVCEQFAATLCLIENGFSSHAPTLVRSMLEALASLLNLTKDPNYLHQMRYDNARNDVILFEEYAHDPEMQKDPDAMAKLKTWKAEATPVRDELAAKGFRTQSMVEKFRKANIFGNYVAYRVFCSFAHNQLTSLIARHAGNFELRFHHDPPVEMTLSTLSVSVGIACQAVNTSPKFSDMPEGELKKRMESIEEIWAKAEAAA